MPSVLLDGVVPSGLMVAGVVGEVPPVVPPIAEPVGVVPVAAAPTAPGVWADSEVRSAALVSAVRIGQVVILMAKFLEGWVARVSRTNSAEPPGESLRLPRCNDRCSAARSTDAKDNCFDAGICLIGSSFRA